MPSEQTGRTGSNGFDTSTDEHFLAYYSVQSQSAATLERFRQLADLLLQTLADAGREGPFEVADIGGGTGTLASMFARAGHRSTCVDLSADLLAVGRERALAEGLEVRFINCSATATPLAAASIDVCVIPELLEHVTDWAGVLDEAARILRPGGLLYLSTTNALCPVQYEFNLPLYSWYPGFLKRRCERLAVTTRPQLANYAKYPAVHWFTYYGLRRALRERGFDRFRDRLDVLAARRDGSSGARLAKVLAGVPLGRFAVQVATDYSLILAFRA